MNKKLRDRKWNIRFLELSKTNDAPINQFIYILKRHPHRYGRYSRIHQIREIMLRRRCKRGQEDA